MGVIIVLVILIIYAVITIAFWGTDASANLKRNMRRRGIGRWGERGSWKRAVVECAYDWLFHTPVVQQTDSQRYVLLDKLQGKYKNATIQSWQTACLVLGLDHLQSERACQEIAKWRERVLSADGSWKQQVDKVDYAMLAYAVLKTSPHPEQVRPAMNRMVEVLENNLCEDGMISYSQGKHSLVRFVDTLGMVCPFLALYAKVYQEPKYIELAVSQIRKFREFGMYEGTQLACHAFQVKKGLPLSIYGWGRGQAWYILGLMDTYLELEDGPDKLELRSYIYEAAQCYRKYQNKDGSFGSIIQGGGQPESSATAALAYFFRQVYYIFENDIYRQVADGALSYLMSRTMKDGAIDGCQGDTHGIGSFSQVYDVMPFAQGLTVRAFF
ncbi:glycoside hydrolase family 88 protein [Eubacterium oxidoreducens]|uniref:Unsaturated rhamnogalacturonyl hydrolase n=1 Tax=Eubacterium oxidoreducens TaxID=1732 RepID=A0A1G6AEA5_EUBOX|nr:glycoside hydrolase family 88 protein [Eubacterium oxidoreducens]SDB06751.1 unsaturated rhamnogalacturonyl hydrolase [Eubacterium oxidoreducens]